MSEQRKWIDDLEIENAQIKWSWSHLKNQPDRFGNEGHYLVVIIPYEDAARLADLGWAIKEVEGLEEGDPPEYHLKVNVSYKYDAPKVYLIRGNRKFRVEDPRDLADIRRDSTERIDMILTPSRWAQGSRTGVTAYVKEMYATVRANRFTEMYDDYEEVR